jgi:DNA-binding transcriptional ArsR family regulator
MDMNAQMLADIMKSLADPTRVRIVALLTDASPGLCVCEIVDALRLPQYQVSRHLAVLRTAGLVAGHRNGTWIMYALRSDLPAPIASIVRAVGSPPGDDVIAEDRRRLRLRLLLRERGVCVVGYDPRRPFREVIPLRDVSRRRGVKTGV